MVALTVIGSAVFGDRHNETVRAVDGGAHVDKLARLGHEVRRRAGGPSELPRMSGGRPDVRLSRRPK